MKKLKIDLIKVKEILSREQLKHIVGGTGSWGQPCTVDYDCWIVTNGSAFCQKGGCVPYSGGGSNVPGCWDRPITEQCHGSTFGCCAATTDTCQMTVGGYFCLSGGS